MKKSIQQALKGLFATLLALNTILIAIIIHLTVSSYSAQKKALIDLGNTILRAFEASRPMIFSSGSGNAHLSGLLGEMFDLKTISNLVIYQKDGEIIFALHPPLGMVKTDVHSRLQTETEKDIVLYNSFHIMSMGGMGRGGRAGGTGFMGGHMENRGEGDNKVFIAIAISKAGLKSQRISNMTTLAVSLITELLIFFLYFRMRQVIKLYRESLISLKNAEKEAATGRLSSILAHEIKNPLSSMAGLISFALKKCGDPQTGDLLNKTQEEVTRLSSIVNDFLAYGGSFDLNIKELPIKSLILKTCDLLSHDAALKKITFEIEGEEFYAPADENKLLQVFVNLLLNALDASPAETAVKITIKSKMKEVLISNALQKPIKGDKEKIFEPFYTTKAKGSGLGLAITRRIIEQHSFSIEAVSLEPFVIKIVFREIFRS